MRVVLLLLFSLSVTGLPVRGLKQMDGDVVWAGRAGSAAEFLKRLYAGIAESDVKSLAVKYAPEFHAMCVEGGSDVVIDELSFLQQLSMSELDTTFAHVHKLGLLLHALFRAAPITDDDA